MNKKIETIIGISGLGGSYLGLAATLQLATASTNLASIIIALLFSVLYALGVFVGYKLLTEPNLKSYKYNFYFWVIQVIAISSPIFTYFFTSGGYFVFGVNLISGGISFYAQFGSKFSFYLFNSTQPLIFYVNIVAIIFSWLLFNKLRKLKIEKIL